jgi:hypothetical protein
VDLTPPRAAGLARSSGQASRTLALEVEASADTARAVALLPWGDRVALVPDRPGSDRYVAQVASPAGFQGRLQTVTLILTDRAHNRSVMRIGVSE